MDLEDQGDLDDYLGINFTYQNNGSIIMLDHQECQPEGELLSSTDTNLHHQHTSTRTSRGTV